MLPGRLLVSAGVPELGGARGGVERGGDDAHNVAEVARVAALAHVQRAAEVFVLHIDVDVLDFTGVPLAGIPDAEGRRLGLTLDELTASVRVFAASARCAAAALTEVNPGHAPDAGTLPHFVERLADALTHG